MRGFSPRRIRPPARRAAASFAACQLGFSKTARIAWRRARKASAGEVAGNAAVGRSGRRGQGPDEEYDEQFSGAPCSAKPCASRARLKEKRAGFRRPGAETPERVEGAGRPGKDGAATGAARIRISRQRRPCSSARIWRVRMRKAALFARPGARLAMLQ